MKEEACGSCGVVGNWPHPWIKKPDEPCCYNCSGAYLDEQERLGNVTKTFGEYVPLIPRV